MKAISNNDLKKILRKHVLWFNFDPEGEKADLRWADLTGADLSGANLSKADLKRCLLFIIRFHSLTFWYMRMYNETP